MCQSPDVRVMEAPLLAGMEGRISGEGTPGPHCSSAWRTESARSSAPRQDKGVQLTPSSFGADLGADLTQEGSITGVGHIGAPLLSDMEGSITEKLRSQGLSTIWDRGFPQPARAQAPHF